MEKRCRLCLSKKRLIWIFDKRIQNTNKLSNVIFDTTGILIKETDLVTQMVCHECCLNAVEIYRFRLQCSVNNNLLHSELYEDGTKTEQFEKNPPDDKPQELSFECEKSYFDEKSTCCDSWQYPGDKEEVYHERANVEDVTHDHTYHSRKKLFSSGSDNRFIVTRAKRKLKLHLENKRTAKQKIIENLYTEKIDKILFMSYLKLAPKYPHASTVTRQGSSTNCKLCHQRLSCQSLRDHLEFDCKIFAMIDNLPTIKLVKVELIKEVKEKYSSAFRNFKRVGKIRKKCTCCD